MIFFVTLKKTFKVVLEYFFNSVVLLKTVFYIKFNIIIKMDYKPYLSKNPEKDSESLKKIFGNPDCNFSFLI